jgi:hypothetical protein
MKKILIATLCLLGMLAYGQDEQPFHGNFYDPDYAIITPNDFGDCTYTIEYEGNVNELRVEKRADGHVILHNDSAYYHQIVTNSCPVIKPIKMDLDNPRLVKPKETNITTKPIIITVVTPPVVNPPHVCPPPHVKPPCVPPPCVKPPVVKPPHVKHGNHSGLHDGTNPGQGALHHDNGGVNNPHH